MPAVPDFRIFPFDFGRLNGSGLSVGRTAYRKLYCIENTLRIVTGPEYAGSACDAEAGDSA